MNILHIFKPMFSFPKYNCSVVTEGSQTKSWWHVTVGNCRNFWSGFIAFIWTLADLPRVLGQSIFFSPNGEMAKTLCIVHSHPGWDFSFAGQFPCHLLPPINVSSLSALRFLLKSRKLAQPLHRDRSLRVSISAKQPLSNRRVSQ